MNGRDSEGRFARNNRFGGQSPGRPKRDIESSYLKSLSNSVSEEAWAAIVTKAIAQAREGDSVARSWLSNYLMGKPVERVKEEHDWTPQELAAALDAPRSGGEIEDSESNRVIEEGE